MGAVGERPIIVKRIKKTADGGHHGGAWKVAYADFVTAMMAFFLLMWLLNATTEVQRKGIADYFNPSIPINRISGGGEGAFGGDSIFSEETLARNGTGASNRNPTEAALARGDTGTVPQEQPNDGEEDELKGLEEMLTGRTGESMVSKDVARHIVTRVTDEGLFIELFDVPGSPIFEPETTQPRPVLVTLIDTIASIIVLTKNEVAVSGHTAALPIVVAQNPVWDLSSDRAQAARKLLEAAAFPSERVQRVTGYADRKPAVNNPVSVRNNRIEIILLRNIR